MFYFRVVSRLSFAFSRIKKAELNKNIEVKLVKIDRNIIISKISLCYQKLNAVSNSKRVRLLGNSFKEIYIYSLNRSVADRTNSIVSPFRDNSKI